MTDEVLGIFKTISDEIIPQAEVLRDLDAKIGDGDLGITITRGMEAVIAGIDDLAGTPASNQLARSGMAFNRAAASTFGVLFATAMMRGGAAVKDREDVGVADVVAIGRAAMQGLMDRGKAKIGDKTLLDALAPAIDAFEEAQSAGKSLKESTDTAVAACEAGTTATIEMQSKVSRAGWLGERSIGVQDPGATAVMYMLQAAQSWVNANT
ncbi:MAG TPA: DAK2 domain-containing protein [Dehalococcoidia bacterium]|jgi:dihydroxyacetone kinase-like protein|nr:dihydroxyacetone kinase subunit L [Chloroflexota bacterium]MDP6055177.1 DAK2 domain-containing protein [Dehalococcoidia bacterium]MDP7090531.1 DAK2 domain-containing protein [Dehalococcoidia bacterium]HJP27504.1 DAK2 domain-containing protein [Dehalococcoidia bacterium]|tara:strand:- start:22598 stop:23227 length:630 start_codon:yes stop_codon:yes gene_type:complete